MKEDVEAARLDANDQAYEMAKLKFRDAERAYGLACRIFELAKAELTAAYTRSSAAGWPPRKVRSIRAGGPRRRPEA